MQGKDMSVFMLYMNHLGYLLTIDLVRPAAPSQSMLSLFLSPHHYRQMEHKYPTVFIIIGIATI